MSGASICSNVFQIKILMFFAAEYTINRVLPNTVLKSTAINALYSNIKSGDRAFYDEFSDGAEYSFYYLAVRSVSYNDFVSTQIS